LSSHSSITTCVLERTSSTLKKKLNFQSSSELTNPIIVQDKLTPEISSLLVFELEPASKSVLIQLFLNIFLKNFTLIIIIIIIIIQKMFY